MQLTISHADGLNIPVEEWQKAIQDQLKKVEKLEADYEADMLMKKVGTAHAHEKGRHCACA